MATAKPSMNLADERKSYLRGQLRRADLLPDPLALFDRWMEDAHAAGLVEPTAMSLATVGADGTPRVRTVLLKGLDARGFVFFTNHEGRKGQHLGAREGARASLLFPWLALERQVMVAGEAAKISEEETRAYFDSRPRESRLAAWASSQSRAASSREELDAALAAMRARFGAEGAVPVPPFWGGWRVRPETVEFWQGRANRMHDRFEYTRGSEGEWRVERLWP